MLLLDLIILLSIFFNPTYVFFTCFVFPCCILGNFFRLYSSVDWLLKASISRGSTLFPLRI